MALQLKDAAEDFTTYELKIREQLIEVKVTESKEVLEAWLIKSSGVTTTDYFAVTGAAFGDGKDVIGICRGTCLLFVLPRDFPAPEIQTFFNKSKVVAFNAQSVAELLSRHDVNVFPLYDVAINMAQFMAMKAALMNPKSLPADRVEAIFEGEISTFTLDKLAALILGEEKLPETVNELEQCSLEAFLVHQIACQYKKYM